MRTRSLTDGLNESMTGSALRSEPITPHATNALPFTPRKIYVGGTGDVTLRAIGSAADVVYKAVPAGTYIEVRAQFVRAIGTTATFLVAEG